MAYDNRDPAYVPSQQALAADAYIASTSPETHPDEYTYYPGFGYTYTGPMAHYTSGTEYNTWLNSSLGGSMFGSGQQVADSQNNNPYIPEVDVDSLMDQFPDAQDTASYLSETNFPDLNPNQVGTVNPIGPPPPAPAQSMLETEAPAQSMLVPMADSQPTETGLSGNVFTVDEGAKDGSDPDFVPPKVLKTFCADTTLNVYWSDGTIEKLENNVNCEGVSNTPDTSLTGSTNGATPNNTNDGTIAEECQGNDLHVYYRVGGKMYSNINRNHISCMQSVPTTSSTSSTSFGPGSNFGASGPGTVNSSFEYTPFQAKDPIEKQQSVDYVKMLRGFLTNSLFKDLI